jgi:two-component system OmpR family sensor kinase
MRHPFRSVGAQLSLALLLVVAIALVVVYEAVVPSLESRLTNARISELEGAGRAIKRNVPVGPFEWEDYVTNASDATSSRVALLRILTTNPPLPQVLADSCGTCSSEDLEQDPLAAKASLTQKTQHGTVTRGGRRFAEVAVYNRRQGIVLLFTDSLQDQLSSVHQVQRRLLGATGAALLIVLLLGYGGARMFARRIRRLEVAADRIASGRFDEPVHDSGGGELRRLADAFERMRVRLAQLDDARREFVANASHELRTPLFSLGGFLELLDDEDLDEATRQEFLTSMREQVVRLTKLASDLLDLTRLDAGRMTVEREPVDLGALAEEIVEEFGPGAQGTRHSLEVSSSEPVFADADELRVLQIGRVLLENALLHTPPETTVRVRAVSRGGRAVLEIEDDGPGIPAEQREPLFERFYRLEGTRASGSGLGLAIARELAELMEGTIEITSPPGRTVFTLSLPGSGVPAAAPFSREKALPTGT